MMMNPQLRSYVESNPQIRAMFSNPQFMDQMQQQMGALGMMPPPPGALGWSAPSVASPSSPLDFTAVLQQMRVATVAPASAPMAAPAALPRTSQPPSSLELYAPLELELQAMGFTDKAENMAALTASGGNLNAAVERLLGGL
jgi:ubiquilin